MTDQFYYYIGSSCLVKWKLSAVILTSSIILLQKIHLILLMRCTRFILEENCHIAKAVSFRESEMEVQLRIRDKKRKNTQQHLKFFN